jgi:hypothetical protein
MKPYLLSAIAAAALLLSAPAHAADECVAAPDVAKILAAQNPHVSLGKTQDAAAILRKVQNVFGPAPHAASDKVAALVLYDGQPAGVVFFDAKGCAADNIIPGPGLMGQILAQP